MSTQIEIRRAITDQIVAHLQDGVRPWIRPWSNDPNGGFPANIVSKRPYSGINPLILESSAISHGFSSRWWGTYRQWQGLGGQVKRRPEGVPAGQWGTTVVYYRQCERIKKDENGDERTERFPLLRTYVLFNLDQVEGAWDADDLADSPTA